MNAFPQSQDAYYQGWAEYARSRSQMKRLMDRKHTRTGTSSRIRKPVVANGGKSRPATSGRKRNRLQRLVDMMEAFRLRREGHTQAQIAKAFNASKDRQYKLTRQQIAYDLEAVRTWGARLVREELA